MPKIHSALVIGMGSIGQRHARLLTDLGLDVAVVSNRAQEHYQTVTTTDAALSDITPDYIVIANPTSDHLTTLRTLTERNHRGLVLVEKPLSADPEKYPDHNFSGLYVAYQLRFHPVIQELRTALGDEPVLTANLYAGSYMPAWRPNRDYRETESASREKGGGVLRDLSHELDYAFWLLGPPRTLTGIGGRIGTLEIDTDSAHALIMSTTRCPVVTIHVSYLDRTRTRSIIITTPTRTLIGDLNASTLTINDVKKEYPVGPDNTYIAMHLAVLNGQTETLCTSDEGVLIVAAIAAAEKAERDKSWVDFP